MDKAIFGKIIGELEAVSSPLTDHAREVYYSKLGGRYSVDQLRKATSALIGSWKYKRCPSIADLRKTLDKIEYLGRVNSTQGEPDYYEGMCPRCDGAGWTPETRYDDYPTGYTVAVYCQCGRGQKLKDGHAEYFRRRKLKEARAKERIYEPPDDGEEATL